MVEDTEHSFQSIILSCVATYLSLEHIQWMFLKMSIFAYNIVTSQYMFQFCFLLSDQNKKKASVLLLCLVAVRGHLTSTSLFPAARLLWAMVDLPVWRHGAGSGSSSQIRGSRSALLNLVLSFSFRTMPKKHDRLLCLFLTWCKSNGVFTFKPLLFLFWFNSDTAEMYEYLLFWCNSGVCDV
jgi:hypothetical protein